MNLLLTIIKHLWYYHAMSDFNHERFQTEVESRGISFNQLDVMVGRSKGMAYKYATQGNIPKPKLLYRYLLAIGFTENELESERLIDWYPLNGS